MVEATLEDTWLTYREAASRVGAALRTVKRWQKQGMPMESGIRDGQRVRLVREDVLLAFWRERMAADPVHQLRIRAILREDGVPEDELPPAPKYPNRKTRGRQKLPVAQLPGDPSPVSDDVTAQNDPPVDWDAMLLRRGADEWALLSQALTKESPACDGHPSYVADRVHPDEALVMAETCSWCPVLAQCRAFAYASRPTSGFWAGEVWPRVRAKSAEVPRTA